MDCKTYESTIAQWCLQCNTHLGGYEDCLRRGEPVRIDQFNAYLEMWS